MTATRRYATTTFAILAVIVTSHPPLQHATAAEAAHKKQTQPTDGRNRHAMTFLQQNCLDCHDGSEGEGGFDLNRLQPDDLTGSSAPKNLATWVRVIDRIADGEMPPSEYGEVDTDQKTRFLKTTSKSIDNLVSSHHQSLGRVLSRRLTNQQLERTLGDLFAIAAPLSQLMPDEQRTDGFRNIADAQSMSHYHLEDHLRVVDAALDLAFARLRDNQDETVIDLPAERIANKRPGQRNRDPELRQGAAVIWSGGVSFYGRISRSTVDKPGWYRITLDASSLKMPDDRGLWCSIRSGKCVSNAPLMHWVGAFEATESPKTFTFTAWIEEDHMLEIRPADVTLKKASFKGGQIGFGEGEPQNVPGVAMHALTIERIYPGGDRAAVKHALFGDLDVRYDRKSKRFELRSDTPAEDLKKRLHDFAAAAFRSPVTPEVLQPYTRLIDRGIKDNDDPIDVLRQAYRAVLCSPRFIYFTEAPGRLSDHAVANRLSYMLTGKAPDTELRGAADAGRLSDPAEIVAQTRRLLDSQTLQYFINDFSDQWLDLADIDFTEPDRRMHRDFDLVVQNAMVGETRRYLETLIVENQPARMLVDSDFTWLNNRLARYYDIQADIAPSQWKRVSIADHPFRGGLMTHGSILKVTANGSNTSPVVRGVWICDRLLGIPIPDPPANVPAIEPDVRGATTVRQILEKHRSQTECASCHAKIDPPGFALEHFDAAGKWRDHYLTRKGKSYKKGPPVDSAYRLADGREFDSFVAFRNLAADDDHRIARNFAAQLLIYATGHEITFADRKTLDQIVSLTTADGYRLRSLIEAVVTSHTFLTK
ncbi:Planctomycete cytochrome C [Stieleria maiorica]|uniref:Planctomycete cytochrome C n=1 Tax=Stieleria maiorica TaxID=2795974 RepID=A0A5B9MPQ2_9BACT|nr:DUF1588 domain-containing protein [Stieleria maiorica]QEG01666.1 Planctomycete cytochrome C [Stieleria maiorica]